MKRWLYSKIFFGLGWSIEGRLPEEEKYILVVAPHTSNWDFLVGLCARAILKFNPRYVAKKELFVWPLGYLFRSLGGYPVERSKSTNFVDQMVDLFEKEPSFILTITPEGTRSYSPNWKSGFFYVAKRAQVPIVPVAFDYLTKTVVLGKALEPKESPEGMIRDLKEWFSQYKGKNPEDGVRTE